MLNDTELFFSMLTGLCIELDTDIDPFTVNTAKGKPTSSTCFVTLDMPYPSSIEDRKLWGDGKTVMGYQPLILAADVQAKGKSIHWKPMNGAMNLLQEQFVRNMDFNLVDRVLAHLTLKGNFIWAQDNPKLYLDGGYMGTVERIIIFIILIIM